MGKSPAYFQSQFLKPYNREEKKAVRVLKFIERGINIINQKRQLPYSQMRELILESPFFSQFLKSLKGNLENIERKRVSKKF